MNAEPGLTLETNCWHCGSKIDLKDNYCRRCGSGQGRKVSWYYGYIGIAVLTVAALGPFSLYFVWKSPRLSPAAKWLYAAGIVAFTWFAGLKVLELYRLAMAALTGQLPELQQLQQFQ